MQTHTFQFYMFSLKMNTHLNFVVILGWSLTISIVCINIGVVFCKRPFHSTCEIGWSPTLMKPNFPVTWSYFDSLYIISRSLAFTLSTLNHWYFLCHGCSYCIATWTFLMYRNCGYMEKFVHYIMEEYDMFTELVFPLCHGFVILSVDSCIFALLTKINS